MDIGSGVAIGCLIAFGIVVLVGVAFATYYAMENKKKSAKLRQVVAERQAQGLRGWDQAQTESNGKE